MNKRDRQPTLPGQILKEFYMVQRKITVKALAEAVGCTPKHISHVIHGKARIEAELATRIAAVLGTTPQLWLNLQNATDLWEVAQRIKGWKPAQTYPAQVHVSA